MNACPLQSTYEAAAGRQPMHRFVVRPTSPNIRAKPEEVADGALQRPRPCRETAAPPVSPAGRPPYYIEGTEGNDSLNGFHYPFEIHGRGGHDTVRGGQSDDLLFGEGGNDQLFGEGSQDTLDGGSGNDTLTGGIGADRLVGGDGFDVVSYATATAGVTVYLGNVGLTNDALGDTYFGIEQLIGSSYDDDVHGDSGSNTINGEAGTDWLFGQAGDDMLTGGAGPDYLSGGVGADTYVFAPGNGADADVIDHFDPGIDRVDVTGFGMNPFGDNGQMEELHVTGRLIGSGWYSSLGPPEADTIVYNTADHTLYQVTTEWIYDGFTDFNRITSATPIAHLSNNPTLTANDFIVMSDAW
jgi:Ca2+-binding RTX toxin-like protein